MPTISPGRATRKVDVALAAQLRLSVLRLARRLRQLDVAAEGVTLSQLSALYILVAQGPLTLGDLAAAEKVQPPTMTRLVSRMEEDGLVRRLAHATDRRIVVVEPTPEGSRLVEASRRRRTAELVRRLATLTEAERATVAEATVLLDRLTEVEL